MPPMPSPREGGAYPVPWGRFAKVELSFNQIHFKGGALKKYLPMTTMNVGCGSNKRQFVKLGKNEYWLSMAISGMSSRYTFARTTLLEDILKVIRDCCNGETVPNVMVMAEDDEYDPMSAVQVENPAANKKRKRSGTESDRIRYYKTLCKDQVIEVNMPLHAPEEKPNSTEKAKIKLFVKDRKQIWLDLDNVTWAVRYLYAQNFLKGVPVVDAASPGPGADQPPAEPVAAPVAEPLMALAND